MKLKFRYNNAGHWQADSSFEDAWQDALVWVIEVTDLGTFDVGCSSGPLLPPHELNEFVTLQEAKDYCLKREADMLAERARGVKDER